MKSPKSKEAQTEPIFLKLLRDPNRFKKLEDGWIRDRLLGVEWGQTSPNEMKFKEAQAYCKKLKGRLPEINELQSIVDYRNYNPAINKDIFADTKSSWYWSGTVHASSSSCAWVVYCNGGSVGWSNEGNDPCVRPVRPSQCS